MTTSTINFSLTSLCNQRSKQLLFNTPQSRNEIQKNPYNGLYTKFQLDMRRKSEVLKYNNNTSSTKTNNITKAGKWSQLVNGNSNYQSSNFPTINLTLIDYQGNYSNLTVKYPDTIKTTLTSQYIIDNKGDIIFDIKAYQIVGNSGYYYIEIISGGARYQCNKNSIIPIPTSSSDVPGPITFLFNDESVPLYNYNTNVNSYSYDSNIIQDKLWLYNPTSDILLTNGNSKKILTMMVSNLVNQPSNIFTLTFPFSLYVTGTDISSNVLLNPTLNRYNFYDLNLGIQSIEFNIKYNNTIVKFSSSPIIKISGSPTSYFLTYNNSNNMYGTNNINNINMNFDISFQQPPISSSDYYSAKEYLGYITISNIKLLTQPGYVYDFYLKVNLSNIIFKSINDKNNYNNIQNTVTGVYINSSTNIIQKNTNIYVSTPTIPYIGGITIE